MSQENVEIVRAVFETWNSGDLDAFGELYDPDAIVREPDGWPETGPFIGREAIVREWRHIREAWNSDVVERVGDFLEAGDRVAVRQVWRGTGHGPNLNMEMTNVFTVRKGKIVYQEFFWDHAEALETLGLSEEPMSQENLEIMRLVHERFSSGDVEGFVSLLDPDVELSSLVMEAEGAVYRGPEGARDYMASMHSTFGAFHSEIVGMRQAGDALVLEVRVEGEGLLSAISIGQRIWQAVKFRDGKVSWGQFCRTEAEALEAAGLSE